jgi:hypothetical protein
MALARSHATKGGLRTGVLGSAVALAIAAPLVEGAGDPTAHTAAGRVGWYFERGVTPHIGEVVNGTVVTRTFQDRFAVAGDLEANQGRLSALSVRNSVAHIQAQAQTQAASGALLDLYYAPTAGTVITDATASGYRARVDTTNNTLVLERSTAGALTTVASILSTGQLVWSGSDAVAAAGEVRLGGGKVRAANGATFGSDVETIRSVNGASESRTQNPNTGSSATSRVRTLNAGDTSSASIETFNSNYSPTVFGRAVANAAGFLARGAAVSAVLLGSVDANVPVVVGVGGQEVAQFTQAGLTIGGTAVSLAGHSHVITDVTGLQTALDGRVLTTAVGAANGVAPLGADSRIPSAYLPAIAVTDTFVVGSQAAMLALTAETGDVAVRTDSNTSFILRGTNPTVLGDWQQLLTPGDAVLSVNGMTGVVTIGIANISGLQTALDAKQPLDAELSAIAGLASVADRMPYFTGTGTAALATVTPFARTLLDDANNTAARSTLGLVIGTNVQAYDAGLNSIAGLTTAADRMLYTTANDVYAVTTLTPFARSLLDDANAAAGRTTLGIGTIAVQNANSVAIDGGAINGTSIGATTPSTGAFTTLDASDNVTIFGTYPSDPIAGRVIIGGGVVSAPFVVTSNIYATGGTIEGTTIGGGAPSTGGFTALTADYAEINQIYVEGTNPGSTDPGTVAIGGGFVIAANGVHTTYIQATGGDLNNTIIGAFVPNFAAFTRVTVSGTDPSTVSAGQVAIGGGVVRAAGVIYCAGLFAIDNQLYSQRSATSGVSSSCQVTGDTQDRWRVRAGGEMNWGSGSAATDVSLSRSAAGVLTVSGALTVTGSIKSSSNAAAVVATGDQAEFTGTNFVGRRSNGEYFFRMESADGTQTVDLRRGNFFNSLDVEINSTRHFRVQPTAPSSVYAADVIVGAGTLRAGGPGYFGSHVLASSYSNDATICGARKTADGIAVEARLESSYLVGGNGHQLVGRTFAPGASGTTAGLSRGSMIALEAGKTGSGTVSCFMLHSEVVTAPIVLAVGGVEQARVSSTGLKLSLGATVSEFSTDGTLAGDSDTALPTEKAVKSYVDTRRPTEQIIPLPFTSNVVSVTSSGNLTRHQYAFDGSHTLFCVFAGTGKPARSTNGGQTWSIVSGATDRAWRAVFCTSAGTFLVVSATHIARCNVWGVVLTETAFALTDVPQYYIAQNSTGVIVIQAYTTSTSVAKLFYSSDDGVTWATASDTVVVAFARGIAVIGDTFFVKFDATTGFKQSTNGATWSDSAFTAPAAQSGNLCTDGASTLVLTSTSSTRQTWSGVYSAPNVTWTNHYSAPPAFSAAFMLAPYTVGGVLVCYIAAAVGKVFRVSTDLRQFEVLVDLHTGTSNVFLEVFHIDSKPRIFINPYAQSYMHLITLNT